MDKISITPRFHIIGSSKDNLIVIKEKPKKKLHTSKNVTKNKSKSHEKIRSHKSCKNYKISHNIFEEKLNLKNKFILRNDFDRAHCVKFLNEKYKMLEKPNLTDEICN